MKLCAQILNHLFQPTLLPSSTLLPGLKPYLISPPARPLSPMTNSSLLAKLFSLAGMKSGPPAQKGIGMQSFPA